MAAETTPPSATEMRLVIFTFFGVISTIPLFFSGYYLARTVILLRNGNPDGTHPCLDIDLAFAIFAVLVSLMASAAVIWRVKPLAITCGIICVIAVLLCFLVTHNVTIRGSNMDPLEEYPRWFRNFIPNDNDWGAFQRHIIQENFCNKEDGKSGDLNKLFLLSGCCYPGDYCGYKDKNQTWVVPKSGQYYEENNCFMWSNDVDKLCYFCNTCKSAYLFRYMDPWFSRKYYVFIACIIWICCFGFVSEADKDFPAETTKAPACVV